jgi:hypothetical protein
MCNITIFLLQFCCLFKITKELMHLNIIRQHNAQDDSCLLQINSCSTSHIQYSMSVPSCKQLLYTIRDHNIHQLQYFIHITHPVSITITSISKIHKEIFFHACILMRCIHDFTFFLKNFCCNYHQQNGNSWPVSNLDSNLQNNKCNKYSSHKF